MYRISKISGKEYLNDIEIPKDDTTQLYIDRCEFLANGGEFIEFEGTPEEIANHQQEQQMIQAKQFIATNKEVGKNFYDDIHLRVTVALFALERNILFPILQEVDTKLYPPLEKIKTGDFASALFIFTNQAPPTNEFVLNFYNEAIQYCQNYYDTKYPK